MGHWYLGGSRYLEIPFDPDGLGSLIPVVGCNSNCWTNLVGWNDYDGLVLLGAPMSWKMLQWVHGPFTCVILSVDESFASISKSHWDHLFFFPMLRPKCASQIDRGNDYILSHAKKMQTYLLNSLSFPPNPRDWVTCVGVIFCFAEFSNFPEWTCCAWWNTGACRKKCN